MRESLVGIQHYEVPVGKRDEAAARRGDPQHAVTVESQGAQAIGWQAIGLLIELGLALGVAAQQAVLGRGPDRTIRRLSEGPDTPATSQGAGDARLELAVAIERRALAVTDPERAVAVLHEAEHGLRGHQRGLGRAEGREVHAIKARQTSRRTDPHGAVARLKQSLNRVQRQALLSLPEVDLVLRERESGIVKRGGADRGRRNGGDRKNPRSGHGCGRSPHGHRGKQTQSKKPARNQK